MSSRVDRIVTSLLVLSLVTSAVAVAPVVVAAADEDEPNDSQESAVSIATGTEITGEVATSDDEDWFSFTAERGETVSVDITVPDDAAGTPYFELRDPDGPIGGEAEVYGNQGGTTTIGFTAERTGTYYLWVYFDEGEYSFTVDAEETDSFEPNEREEDAHPVAFGQLESGVVTTGDDDWFVFDSNVTAGETLIVNATVPADAPGNPYFELQNDDGPLGGAAEDYGHQGGTVTIGKTIARPGRHYLWVYFDQGAYNFTARTKTTDPFEPNEGRSTATRLFENPFTPTEAVRSIGDEDWFAFRADAGEEIRVTGDSSTNQVFADIVSESGDENGTYLRSDESNVTTFTPESGGTYYLKVYFDTSRYQYDLTVGGEPLGLANDRFERPNPPIGNQDRANATDLDSGFYADLGMVDDDRDVFAIDLAAGERVIADADFDHAENDIALELTDDGGTTVADADTSTDGERLAFTATEDATYYLAVTGEAGAQSRYDLDLTTLRRVDVTVGPGGETLEPGTTATFDVTVSGVSSGLETTNLTLASSNTSVLTIEAVDAADSGTVDASVSSDGGSATANVTGLDATAAGTVTVAEVTVAAVENGSATLSGDADISAAGGLAYPVAGVQGTDVDVQVAPAAPDVTGDGNPASDPDGDGRYEDVNGDGSVTPGDATVLFNAVFAGNAAVTDNVALFDFNGDGSVTPGDATVLFNEAFAT